ncbi:MAG: pyridoxal-phosphate dependent enzyme [Candidatus Sericytochromatia bacterium]
MGSYRLVCTGCGAEPDRPFSPFCPTCGSMTDIAYDLGQVQLAASANPFTRFFDLLPVSDRALLPAEAAYTPLVHARALGRRLKLSQLYLKNETVLPTGTTKYRMAAVALPYLYESGVRHFCTSSTGNSSTAYAHQIGRLPGLKMSLFTSSDFRTRVNYTPGPQIDHYILLNGTFVDASDCAAAFARRHGHTGEQGFFNPGRREGLKLTFLEAAEQLEQPIDWYVQAVSSAMGVYGTFKGAKELWQLGKISRLPQLLCVQQQSCAPMVRAWQEDSEAILDRHIVLRPQGIAYAILRGDPSRAYPYMRSVVQASGGDFTAVSEAEIHAARQLVQELEGLEICFAAAAAVAGVIQSAEAGRLATDACVVINLTGSDRCGEPAPEDVHFLEQADGEWRLLSPESVRYC